MASISFEAKSLLGIDLGSVNTRAVLFDAVEDRYNFIAAGMVPSTHIEPFFDVGEGVFQAISRLQEITGRILLDMDGNLIIPSQAAGEGIDRFVLTTSCGNPLNIIIFGLLNDVSLDSVQRLANTTYGIIKDAIGINDRRSASVQMDAVLALEPDLILFSGGTEGGASRSVLRVAEMIASLYHVLPEKNRPRLLYCGNSHLGKKVNESLDKYTRIRITKNIRPTIDVESFEPAKDALGEMVLENRYDHIGGLKRMVPICNIPPAMSNLALERIVGFLGKQYDPGKGVLGVDLGASFTVAAFANHQKSTVNTFPIGMGEGLNRFLNATTIQEIRAWLDDSFSEDEVRDYLYQRSLFPQSLAADKNSLEIELAAARQILRQVMKDLRVRSAIASDRYEPLLISGATLNRTPSPQEALLTILDGIQPVGICPLILDKHNILPMLGTIAPIDPLMVVQVLESTAFVNLATTISILSHAKYGHTILKARLEYASGDTSEIEVRKGSIVTLPLASGEKGVLYLRPTRQVEIEDVDISTEPVKVSGGVCGVVIDARGRPLKLPANPSERGVLYKDWKFLLGMS